MGRRGLVVVVDRRRSWNGLDVGSSVWCSLAVWGGGCPALGGAADGAGVGRAAVPGSEVRARPARVSTAVVAPRWEVREVDEQRGELELLPGSSRLRPGAALEASSQHAEVPAAGAGARPVDRAALAQGGRGAGASERASLRGLGVVGVGAGRLGCPGWTAEAGHARCLQRPHGWSFADAFSEASWVSVACHCPLALALPPLARPATGPGCASAPPLTLDCGRVAPPPAA